MEFTISTTKKQQCIDISEQVNKALKNSKIKNGLLNIYTTHSTTAIIINENHDPNIKADLLSYLEKQIPQGIWLHDKIDGNGAAHIKASLLSPSESIPIQDNKLQLGQWQSPMLIEFDGPRQRKIIISIISN